MRKKCLIMFFLLAQLLTSCSFGTPKVTEVYGFYEDDIIQVKVTGKWNKEKGSYSLEGTIYNKTNRMIQVLTNCNEHMGYTGKTIEGGCNEAYSMGLQGKGQYIDTMKVPKKFLQNKNEKFNITLAYSEDINSDAMTKIDIPIEQVD